MTGKHAQGPDPPKSLSQSLTSMASRLSVYVASTTPWLRERLCEIVQGTSGCVLVGSGEDPISASDPMHGINANFIILEAGPSFTDTAMVVRKLTRLPDTTVLVIGLGMGVGSRNAIELIRQGAIDAIEAPTQPEACSATYSGELGKTFQIIQRARERSKMRQGASAVRPAVPEPPVVAKTAGVTSPAHPPTVEKPSLAGTTFHPRQIVLIGASTGGTEAIREVLAALPAAMPPIAIIQHIPSTFSKAFAARLNAGSAVEVREACDGDVLRPGLALVAPGGFHMEIRWEKHAYVVRLTQAPHEHHQRPAADVTFRTAAEIAGSHALGIILTGMGRDGTLGMKQIKDNGGYNIAQDEQSCVVFGMPAAAIQAGVVDQVWPLQGIAQAIIHQVQAGCMNSRGSRAA
ncbi:MAG: hypothetical protein FJ405_19710 [Verrucomicrobia bacterium]|nr:hypothetical protein [Verrucomicrobiota bacterium]